MQETGFPGQVGYPTDEVSQHSTEGDALVGVIGQLAQKDGDRETARLYFERTIALDPEHGDAHFFLGGLYLNEFGDVARARRHLERALTLPISTKKRAAIEKFLNESME